MVKCIACWKELKEGDRVSLVRLGPGDNSQQRAKALAGEDYNCIVQKIHYDCADPHVRRLEE